MTRLFVILFCCYPFLSLFALQEEIQENQIEDDEMQLEHMKETQGVRWFAKAARSNKTENERYARTQSFDVESQYKSVPEEEILKAQQDSNVTIERDYLECQHAYSVARERMGLTQVIGMSMSISKSMANNAEKWAIYLSSRLTSGVDDKIFFNEADRDKEFGQLIYYAEGLDQAPGCNMAVTAWIL